MVAGVPMCGGADGADAPPWQAGPRGQLTAWCRAMGVLHVAPRPTRPGRRRCEHRRGIEDPVLENFVGRGFAPLGTRSTSE